MRRRLAGLIALVLGLVGCVGDHANGPANGSGLATQADELSVTLGDQRRLVVDSPNGSVTVIGDREDRVEVTAEKKVVEPGDPTAIKLVVAREGDAVSVTWTPGTEADRSPMVDLIVHCPSRMAATLTMRAGAARVKGLDGDIAIGLGTGGVAVEAGKGKVEVKSGDGAIHVSGLDATLKAETGVGSITASGTFRGDSLVKTRAGTILVVIPPKNLLKVEASTATGDLTDDFNLARTQPATGRALAGTIGDGSDGALTIRAEVGSISLKRAD